MLHPLRRSIVRAGLRTQGNPYNAPRLINAITFRSSALISSSQPGLTAFCGNSLISFKSESRSGSRHRVHSRRGGGERRQTDAAQLAGL